MSRIGIIGGTGLEKVFEPKMTNVQRQKVTTEAGDPSDEVLLGEIESIPVAILPRHGRKHDKNPTNVPYAANILALKKLGCGVVLGVCAVGSNKKEYAPGHLAILSDAIDRTTRFPRTLYPNRVQHMAPVPLFNNRLRNILISELCNEDFEKSVTKAHHNGVIVVIEGPRFSTHAECKMHIQWGADLVGMTLMPEAPIAKEAGLLYASLAMVTDYDCFEEEPLEDSGIDDSITKNHEVIETMKTVGQHAISALKRVLPIIAKDDWQNELALAEKAAQDSFLF